jgi:phosphoglycerol transferase MdoB-like AlkP superfamily enzyme
VEAGVSARVRALGRGLNVLFIVLALWVTLKFIPDPITTLISFAFFAVPFGLAFAATGQLRRSLTVAAGAVAAVFAVYRLKKRYFDGPLNIGDAPLILDSANWEVLLLYPLAMLAVVLLPLLLVAPAFLHRSEARRGSDAVRLAALVVAVAWTGFVYGFRDHRTYDFWNNSGAHAYGPFANLVYSTQLLRPYQPPRFEGNDAAFTARAAAAALPATAVAQPDIVVWMCESTVDTSIFRLDGARLPRLAMFEPDESTRDHGWLRVHTWGGNTALAEFTMLTGLLHTDFGLDGQAAFYRVTPHIRAGLPRLLRERGYSTVALTAVRKSLSRSEAAYRELGFETVLDPRDMGFDTNSGPDAFWNMPEANRVGYARRLLESSPGRPVFLYMKSVRQHGSYDDFHPIEYGLENSGLPRTRAAQLSDYWNNVEELDRAVMDLWRYLEARQRPTLFLYFGDHQSYLLRERRHYRLAVSEPHRVTSLMVKDNFRPPSPAVAHTLTDIAFLPGLILERAGVAPDAAHRANMAMRRLCGGHLADCTDTGLVRAYRSHLYSALGVARPLAPAATGGATAKPD